MSFVVEDGTGKSDATSYLSVADADTYHSDRGNSSWAEAGTILKQQALIKATSYLEANYTWVRGTLVNDDQALGWPRVGSYDKYDTLIDDDVIPPAVQHACAELAFRALSEDLDPDEERPLQSFRAGSLSVTWSDATTEPKVFSVVGKLLAGIAIGSDSGNVRLDLV